MLYDKLIELKNHVLLKNTYFNKGFSFTYQDQGIWSDEDDKEPIFPRDDLGNYFYFRLPNDIGLTTIPALAVGDCAVQASAQAQIILVACVRNADNDLLMKNLINTISDMPVYAKTFTSGILMKEKVVRQELSFLSGDELQNALKKIPKDYSIVSINFTITNPISFNRCIENPCSC
jgi:hypothetical protein